MPPPGWTVVTGENGKEYWRNDTTEQWFDPDTGDIQIDPSKEWKPPNNRQATPDDFRDGGGAGGTGGGGGQFEPGAAPPGMIWVDDPVYDPYTGDFLATRKKLISDPSYQRPSTSTARGFDPWRESPEERERDRKAKQDYQDALLKDKEADREIERIKAEMQDARLRGDSAAEREHQKALLEWDKEKTAIRNALDTARLKLDERQIDANTGLQWSELLGVGPQGQNTLARDELAMNDAYRKAQIALQQDNAEEAKRQFDIAEGFKQRMETAKLQFERERDPASFMSKLFAISGQEAPPETQMDLGRALRPYDPTVQPRTPDIAQQPAQPTGGPPATQGRPWWENFDARDLMGLTDAKLSSLPPDILGKLPNEFFLKRPALMAFLTPDRIKGEGIWAPSATQAPTGFAQDIIDKYGKGAPVPKIANTGGPTTMAPGLGPTTIPRPRATPGTAPPGTLDYNTLAGDGGQAIQPQPTAAESFVPDIARPAASIQGGGRWEPIGGPDRPGDPYVPPSPPRYNVLPGDTGPYSGPTDYLAKARAEEIKRANERAMAAGPVLTGRGPRHTEVRDGIAYNLASNARLGPEPAQAAVSTMLDRPDLQPDIAQSTGPLPVDESDDPRFRAMRQSSFRTL